MSHRTRSKGITPVVATVLLLTISVAATASAYTFITNAQKNVAQNFEQQLSRQEMEERTSLNIEYVYNSTGNYTFMTVRNTGSVTLMVEENDQKVLSLYADGQPVSSDVGTGGKGWKYVDDTLKQSAGGDPQEYVMNPSQVLSINTTRRFPPRGESTAFKLTGEYGVTDSHVCYNTGSNSC